MGNARELAELASVVIVDGGNVGIGAAPNNNTGFTTLAMQGANGSVLELKSSDGSLFGRLYSDSASTAVILNNNKNGPLSLGTNNAERVRIDSAGNVGIGTSAPAHRLSVKQSGNTSVASFGLTVSNSANDTFLGLGYDATSDTLRVNATYSSTGAYKPISFWTSDAERARIDSSGNLLVGTTSGNARLTVVGRGEFSGFSGAGYQLAAVSPSGGDRDVFIAGVLGISNGLTVRYVSGAMQYTLTGLANGTVSSSGGVLSASSDQNLKVADGAPSSAIEKTLALKPRYFYWKDKDGNANEEQGRQLGFFAQEVNEVLPEAAPAPKTDEEGWGVYDRSVVALLTAAIQEQQAIINDLKARLDAANL
jgi:hypothetical protein